MALTDPEVLNAVCRFFRVATVVLSLASAAVMLSANESTGSDCDSAPEGEVSYSDYNSFTYGLAANFASVALQIAAAWLTWRGGVDDGEVVKTVAELIDKFSEVFLSSSAGLSFAVDDFGKCGGGRRLSGTCECTGVFCKWVRTSGGLSIAAAIALAVSNYIKDLRESEEEDEDEHKAVPGCGRGGHYPNGCN